MTRIKRVAVTSPQTRLAHSRRRAPGRWRVPTLEPADAERAARLYREQRRRALPAVALMFALLLVLTVAFTVAPGLDSVRVLGIPLSWLMLAAVPYPAMAWLARWQLRRAERAERE
ncbi:hypothetical protein [Amycolatopsis sp. CA-230715]|uniref:hypothetical protein n=1 Tax=Amycolatopsis sp. CA-230715 TaxID=2745196 RepID=UPI001C00F1C6|nr:hypothetical protein [Amycolatopsis sp. CA-230715]QWF82765.1 hypothetical protein HUW46_06204 [Amycolatopsis sp. CA-230715]